MSPNDRPLGPVLSSDLYSVESRRLEGLLQDSLRSPADELVEHVGSIVAGFLQEAYTTGLRDGFAQGVASAHYRPESEKPDL